MAANAHVSNHLLLRLELPRSQVIYHGVPDPLADSAGPALPPDTSPTFFAYVRLLVQEKEPHVLIEAGA
jgi:hypothetical protein